ncbi:cytochrome P450 [Calocera cornea HHB12733]|uniref:Cytochrome P450 n=1 Tax=Calocera cornea HHB12733 TaxID=1353952 RepID=A0A165EAG3_9BASI|nr:cytochrome P450 [Calocera cornea HHB12733]
MISLVCIISVLCVLSLIWASRRTRVGYPPGPKGLPVLGNILQISGGLLFLQLAEWAKTQGPIYTVMALGSPLVVINSAKIAGDLLDRSSSATSDRPALIKACDFQTKGWLIVLLNRGERWRWMRKATHDQMNVRDVKTFQPLQEDEATALLKGLACRPDIPLVEHLHRVSASIGWRVLWGFPAIPVGGPDPSHRIDELSGPVFKASVPGASIVDIVPSLKPIITRSKFLMKESDALYEEMTAIFTRLFSSARTTKEWGTSFAAKLRDQERSAAVSSAHGAAWLTGALFLAANETTATTLRYFTLAMVLYPDRFEAARKELDSVLGGGRRPPTFSDFDDLPRVEAIVKEVLRWRPPAPLGIPHVTTEDVRCNGYAIPKGTFLVPNVWSICRDPSIYSDGDQFDPSRFLDENGRLEPGAPDTHNDYIPFGFGRRVCSGKALATNSLWICIASILWAFTLEPAKDADGTAIIPSLTDFVDTGATVQPAPFPVKVIPRFPDLLERVDASMVPINY